MVGALSGRKARILIADDHPIFREGLGRILSAQPDLEVVGEAADGDEAIRQANSLRPDIVLLDVSMPQRTGLDVLREIASSGSCRVLLLTAGITRGQIVEALQLGACGVVLKEAGSVLLYKAIRAVAAGEYWIERGSVGDVIQQLRQRTSERTGAAKFGLTRRELQIIAAIVAGCTNRDISEQFSVSADTVKHHVSNVFDKLGVSNRVELALFAIDHGLVDRDQPA
jgi:DNA-binding NarL/FixJ family response regulator